MPRLSVLYVIRNEQDLIEKSLKSIQPIADEIVIVDTGSLDKTISICRKFPYVKIFSHAWVHDFSKTKNYGIKQCTGDWILSMDADELLDPASASTIRGAVNNAKPNLSGFSLHVVDHETAFDANSPSNEKTFFASPQTRVFRKGNIFFEGKVLESATASAKKAGGVDLLDAKIHHFLWHGKGAEFKEGRLRYYEKLGASISMTDNAPVQLAKSSEAPQVAIIIPAFNALSSTKECIGAIAAHTQSSYVISFVDNGSNDGTFEFMRGFNGKNPIKFPSNLGVARAKNAGAREPLGNPNIKYLCFLDNDTRPTQGWLDKMISIMERDPKIGLVGPLSNSADGAQNIYTQQDSQRVLEQREPEFFLTDSVNGFCMVVSTEAARRVGLFDESFGLYGFEDKDLCRRMKASGYEVAIANRAFVEHRGRVSVTENRMDWQKLMTSASIKFSQKYAAPSATPVIATGPKSPESAMQRYGGGRPKFSFVILVHNRLDMTKECIESILATSPSHELIIVDNASTDGSLDWIKSRCPNAVCIRNEKNLGVPVARNQGIKATTTDFIVIMDNDVVLKPGWYDELFTPIKDGADIVGIEGWQIDVGFAASWKCQNSNERFDYLGGACNVFRRSVFERVGLLDEGFSPAYYEDVDICIRAKNGGMKLVWMPTQKIVHKEHATLIHGQRDFKYQEALVNSHARFARKMRREIHVQHEMLPLVAKKFRVLYLGMEWDYGFRERGPSFEHANFYPALTQWSKTSAFEQFDFVDLGKQHGIDRMSGMLLDKVKSFEPDIMFCVFFDSNHDPRKDIVARITAETKTKTIGWFCDSHFRYDNFDKLWAPALSYNVTTSSSAYQRYVQDGFAAKVIKSQWGASPSYAKLDLPKDIDISFVGQPHGDRRQVIEQIKRAGIDVQCYGTGWPQRLSFDGMINVWNRSKINLNLNNACDVRFKQIKGRNFEVPAVGGFLLTGHAENLEEYYEIGKEVVTFNAVEDMIEKIKHYLAHNEEREAVANAGYARTMKDHTFEKRLNDIVAKIGLI